jgi:hypothetical protein
MLLCGDAEESRHGTDADSQLRVGNSKPGDLPDRGDFSADLASDILALDLDEQDRWRMHDLAAKARDVEGVPNRKLAPIGAGPSSPH